MKTFKQFQKISLTFIFFFEYWLVNLLCSNRVQCLFACVAAGEFCLLLDGCIDCRIGRISSVLRRADYLHIALCCVAAEEFIMHWSVCRVSRIHCVLMRTDYLRIDVYCVAAEELIMYWFVCRIRRINCVLIRVSRWKNSFCVQAYEFFTFVRIHSVTSKTIKKSEAQTEAQVWLHIDVFRACFLVIRGWPTPKSNKMATNLR